METRSGIPQEDWDEKLIKLNGHFLQSRAWASFQTALGKDVFYCTGEDWLWLAISQRAKFLKYLYIPYGPTVASEKGLDEALESIKKFARENKYDFIRFEPNGSFNQSVLAQKYTPSKEVQPETTSVLNLIPDKEDLLANCDTGHRSRIRHAGEKNIAVAESTSDKDIDDYLEMHHQTISRAGIKSFGDSYYRTLINVLGKSNNAKLYFATIDNKKIASAIVFDFNDTRYYAFAAADQELNRQTHCAVVLLWQLIVDAKDEGRKNFDFWGVAPEGAINHPWSGLSSFKRGFGGTDKKYSGTWDLAINTAKYRMYSLLKR